MLLVIKFITWFLLLVLYIIEMTKTPKPWSICYYYYNYFLQNLLLLIVLIYLYYIYNREHIFNVSHWIQCNISVIANTFLTISPRFCFIIFLSVHALALTHSIKFGSTETPFFLFIQIFWIEIGKEKKRDNRTKY